MSLSKLESLPNELLCDIIEKYINGVDILVAFNHQLNNRFNALICQSQRLRFNFIRCKKDDFRFCMGLLPVYVDQVEELAVSDEDTPGQVHSFLSFFPSFEPFKQLRRLYFNFDGEATESSMIQTALRSLLKLTVDTLSIKATNTTNIRTLPTMMTSLLSLISLKRLSLMSDSTVFNYNHLMTISSNIEYLTISDEFCHLNHLQSIFRCTRRLKYANVRIGVLSVFPVYKVTEEKSKKDVILMSELHTLILFFEDSSVTTNNLLNYLKDMPVLNRLEVKGHEKLMDADAWELLLARSLPTVTHFHLQTSVPYVSDDSIDNLLGTFQGLFWKSRKNFKITVTEYIRKDSKSFHSRYNEDDDYDQPIIRYWTAPDRHASDKFTVKDEIKMWCLCKSSTTLSHHCYYGNIKCLVVDRIDRSSVKWLTKFVNYSKITGLVTRNPPCDAYAFASLLEYITNMNSLCVYFDLLIATKHVLKGKHNQLKRLDISIVRHPLQEKDIIVIAELFPYIEHLNINTSNLNNVPLLKTYLPHLRTLTFTVLARFLDFDIDDDYARKKWCYELTLNTQFLFQLNKNSITVWLDQAAFDEPYWRTYVVNRPPTTTASITTEGTDDKKKKKNKFSFLNLFK